MDEEAVKQRLSNIAEMVGEGRCVISTSENDVPHLVVRLRRAKASVVYFSRTQKFRVFYPYPSGGLPQLKSDAWSEGEAVEHLRDFWRRQRRLEKRLHLSQD